VSGLTDELPPLQEDLRSIIEHLPQYSGSEDGPTGELTLTSLRDRALLLVGWTGALRQSELVALTTGDMEFIGGRRERLRPPLEERSGRSGARQGLPYSSNKETWGALHSAACSVRSASSRSRAVWTRF
jgi:integrase